MNLSQIKHSFAFILINIIIIYISWFVALLSKTYCKLRLQIQDLHSVLTAQTPQCCHSVPAARSLVRCPNAKPRYGTLDDSTARIRRCGDSTAVALATCHFWTQCERYKNATFGVTCVKQTPYAKSSYPCYLCVHVRTGRAMKLGSKSQLLD